MKVKADADVFVGVLLSTFKMCSLGNKQTPLRCELPLTP